MQLLKNWGMFAIVLKQKLTMEPKSFYTVILIVCSLCNLALQVQSQTAGPTLSPQPTDTKSDILSGRSSQTTMATITMNSTQTMSKIPLYISGLFSLNDGAWDGSGLLFECPDGT